VQVRQDELSAQLRALDVPDQDEAELSQPVSLLAMEQDLALEADQRQFDIEQRLALESTNSQGSEFWITHLSDALTAAQLDQHRVSDVDCRQALCELTFENDPGVPPSDVIDLARRVAAQNTSGDVEGFYRSVQNANGTSSTHLYLSQGGHPLPGYR
jgi:hypothetical protein|tara:strand:- start:5548 stop:6018 length:471 start_codon:yes stop_codon:yes gene_type:complete